MPGGVLHFYLALFSMKCKFKKKKKKGSHHGSGVFQFVLLQKRTPYIPATTFCGCYFQEVSHGTQPLFPRVAWWRESAPRVLWGLKLRRLGLGGRRGWKEALKGWPKEGATSQGVLKNYWVTEERKGCYWTTAEVPGQWTQTDTGTAAHGGFIPPGRRPYSPIRE